MNAKPEIIEERGRETVVVPKQGGFARVLRKCHWCGKPTTNYGCSDCKRRAGWSNIEHEDKRRMSNGTEGHC